MGLQITSTTVSASEIASNIKIEFPEGLTRSQKKRIKDQAGDLIVQTILTRASAASSPIRGGSWKATLSKEYKKLKRAAGGSSIADMDLTGGMLEALGFVRTADGIRLRIKGKAALRADGHNNFSGNSSLPTRQSLPQEGDKFKDGVERDIDNLIADMLINGN